MIYELIITINIIIMFTFLWDKRVHPKYKDPIIISIEGNIGVGKSTLINIFSQLLKNNCEIIYEPVDLWLTITDGEKNILQLFYDDKKKWAFVFQMIAGLSIIENITKILKKTTNKYIFLDRSFLTTKYTFEKMLYDSGDLNEIEHTTYKLLCSHYENNIYKDYKHIHIYLKCDPEVSFERIKKRNRTEESNITLEYLTELSKYHDEWLLKNDNVLVIDCNNNTLDNILWYKNILNDIKIKINS